MQFLCVWISAFECSALGVQKRASGPSALELGAAWHGCYTALNHWIIPPAPWHFSPVTRGWLLLKRHEQMSPSVRCRPNSGPEEHLHRTLRIGIAYGINYWGMNGVKGRCITEEPIPQHRWWGKKAFSLELCFLVLPEWPVCGSPGQNLLQATQTQEISLPQLLLFT